MSVLTNILPDVRSSHGLNPQSPSFWIQQLFGDRFGPARITENNALTISAWWNGINIISGTIGWLPFAVFERRADGGRTRVPTHPVHTLLHDRPNPLMDALVFQELLQSHALAWGNGYAEIERNGAGDPIALWPLPPNRVTPEVTDDRLSIRYKFIDTDGKPQFIRFENMFHLKGLGFDGIKGFSVVRIARESLGTTKAIERYGSRFFENNATPPAVLEYPGVLTDTSVTNLRNSWEKQHKGPDNAGKIAILEQGMKLNQIGVPPEDAQYLSSRKFSVIEIARWLDIPPHMLKELERATFSNIEQQGIEFVTLTLVKWFKRWEHEANFKLFNTEDRSRFFAEFIPNALLRGDTKARFEAYRMSISSGWMNRNEIRIIENLNPDEPELDKYLQPLNFVTVGQGTSEDLERLLRQARAKTVESSNESDQIVMPVCGEEEKDSAFRELFECAWRRIVTKEVNSLSRIIKKKDVGPEAIENFYQKHFTDVEETLGPVLRVFGADSQAVQEEVEKYIDDSKNDLLAALKNWNPVDTLLEWKENKAVRMAEEFLQRGAI